MNKGLATFLGERRINVLPSIYIERSREPRRRVPSFGPTFGARRGGSLHRPFLPPYPTRTGGEGCEDFFIQDFSGKWPGNPA